MAHKIKGPDRVLLCAIAKDEDQYILEWLEYHLALGFHHIVIYDNESSAPLESVVSTFDPTKVSIIPWVTEPGFAPQVAAYNNCLKKYSSFFSWLLFLDIDEFLNLKIDNSVGEFVGRFSDVDMVSINWRIFGSSHHRRNSEIPVLNRFMWAAKENFPPNSHVKTLFRPEKVNAVDVHSPCVMDGALAVNASGRHIIPGPLQSDIDFSVAQINHYFVKSADEFDRKRRRGRADVPDGQDAKYRPLEEFVMYDMNDEFDHSILRQSNAGGYQMRRVDVVQSVINVVGRNRYLEIGVDFGETFHEIDADYKVAVDPHMKFDVQVAASERDNCDYRQMTSDEFFLEKAINDKFEVIYIDGLHTFEQTLRDLLNSIVSLQDDGVIIVDDVLPSTYSSSLNDLRDVSVLRSLVKAESHDGSWMGDVYKLVFFVENFLTSFNYATIIENHGQMIMWRGARDGKFQSDKTMKQIAEMDFLGCYKGISAFRQMPCADVLSLLSRR